jgi:hypothetical protein
MRFPFGFLCAVCVACSTTPGISIVATPNPIPGDGTTSVTVTASVNEGGSPVDGATVHFVLAVQGGVPGAATYAAWDNADPGTPANVDATSTQGTASATLKAPRQGFGTIKFTASFSSQGKEPSASVTVPLSPAGGPATSISFVCEHQNIGALVTGRNTIIHTLCRATALDASNHAIPGASVQTLSEAGTLSWQKDDTGVQEFLYAVRPDDPLPKDVGPLGTDGKEQSICPSSCNAGPFTSGCQGEPCWVDATGITHNPRDGVVTLVAAVPAVKGFDNQGEPFVDKNDNGTRDPDEPFIDYNGNGKWDGPTGALQDHMVWTVFRIIWSGEAQVSPTGTGTTHDSFIASDPSVTGGLILNIFDRNLNALAADGIASSDGIAWAGGTCTGDGSVSPLSSDQPMDQTHPGILFTAATGAISNPGSRTTYTRNIDYHNSFTFTGTAGQTCTGSALPHRQYDPGAPGYDSQVETTNPDVGISFPMHF